MYFFVKTRNPRPTFQLDMTSDERTMMQRHVEYWSEIAARGAAIVFGPVMDPNGGYGIGVCDVDDETALRALLAQDPARDLLQYEVFPMPRAVVGAARTVDRSAQDASTIIDVHNVHHRENGNAPGGTMSPEQAKAAAEMMATLWEGEFPATCQVIAAVKDDNRHYRPDPKSRTAWELATHLATADIWFISSIVDGAFVWDPEAARRAASQFENVKAVVEFYTRTFPAALNELRALPAAKMTDEIDFFGMMKMTRAQWIGFANNHSVHHRGQLAAYLRAMGSKVPNIYGPSADAEPATA